MHIMKTAGSFVDRYLRSHVLRRHAVRRWSNYTVKNSWEAGLDRDWTDGELRSFLELPDRRMYVHNHVNGWSESLIDAYRAAGYYAFTWVRHPGDAVCSFFHWREKQEGPADETLDTFVKNHVDADRPWAIPPWWERLDFVAAFTDDAFDAFLVERFGVRLETTEKVNASANLGFDHYVATGAISAETAAAMESSQQMRIYREIRRA